MAGLGLPAPSIEDPSGQSAMSPAADLREDYAYREGLQAYPRGFPWISMATLRYLWTNVPVDPVNVPYAALNRFWHMERLADAQLRDGAQPNNDTPYSTAWLDLTAEPVILSHRDMGSRWFAFDLIGMGLERLASVTSHLTGPAAGAFAIRGPDWHGRLPPGVVPLPRANSNSVLLIGRTECHGIPDLRAVREAQSGYRLVPLSRWPDAPLPPESRAVLAPVLPHGDPLGDWKTMNLALTADPPPRTATVVEAWAHLGIGAGLHVEAQPEPTRRGLARAAARARRTLAARSASHLRQAVGGWVLLPSPNDTSLHGSAFGRWQVAATGALGWRRGSRCAGHVGARRDGPADLALGSGRGGLELMASLACDPSHAPVEFAGAADAGGLPLVGGRSYRLRFEPGLLPPARFFWSATLYTSDGNLMATETGRSTIGDLHREFRLDPDGGTTIEIGPTPPAGLANWLSASVDGRSFYLVFRLYAGDRASISATWWPPAITPVEATAPAPPDR